MSVVAAPVPVARAAGSDDRYTAAVAALHFDRLDAMTSSDKSLTPVTMFDTNGIDSWDGGSYPSKRSYGRQPAALEVPRNDYTPLNTPYTPQLVKLHLKRHDDEYYAQHDHATRNGAERFTPAVRALVSNAQTKLRACAQPVLRIRSIADAVMELVLPNVVLRSRVFSQTRTWLVWYVTTVISVPIALLLSPLAIAVVICTSPIWLAGVAVVLVRTLFVPAWHHEPLTDAYVHKASPAHKQGTHPTPNQNYSESYTDAKHHRMGKRRSSHPNSIYRHANITSSSHESTTSSDVDE